jgi:anaerobic C4-dicarboxylate transporter DcuB
MDIAFLLETVVVVVAILLGVRAGSVGLGMWGAVGTLILVFVFGLPPGSPPTAAMLVIIAVITAAATMQAAGGIDWLVGLATRILQARPRAVVYVAPLVAFFFTVGAGTGNVYYPLIPVIYQLSYRNGIRPERALGPAGVASQMGIVCSPVSAAMAAMITLTGPEGYDLTKVLSIVLPASLVAIVVAALVQSRRGRNLTDDPEYQRRIASGQLQPPDAGLLEVRELPRAAFQSALIFLVGVAVIVIYGFFKGPILAFLGNFGIDFGDTPPDSTTVIQLVMLTAAAIMLVVTHVEAADVPKQSVFSAGMVAMIALFGLAWLADTYVAGNSELIVGTLGNVVENAPEAIAIVAFTISIFLVAALTTSQSAATRTIIPIGLTIGLPVPQIIAMWQAVIGIYFLPANGSQLAAINIDETGSTKIGKFVLNHSFEPATLIGAIVSVAVGLVIATLLFPK